MPSPYWCPDMVSRPLRCAPASPRAGGRLVWPILRVTAGLRPDGPCELNNRPVGSDARNERHDGLSFAKRSSASGSNFSNDGASLFSSLSLRRAATMSGQRRAASSSSVANLQCDATR